MGFKGAQMLWIAVSKAKPKTYVDLSWFSSSYLEPQDLFHVLDGQIFRGFRVLKEFPGYPWFLWNYFEILTRSACFCVKEHYMKINGMCWYIWKGTQSISCFWVKQSSLKQQCFSSTLSNHFIIDSIVLEEHGDNGFGSVCPSVCSSVSSMYISCESVSSLVTTCSVKTVRPRTSPSILHTFWSVHPHHWQWPAPMGSWRVIDYGQAVHSQSN